MTQRDFVISLLGLFLLIAINAFFTAAEFSIISVRRSRITQLVASGDLQAQTVQSLQKSIERLLSTTQLGITLSSLALGWIGERTIAVLIRSLIEILHLPNPLKDFLSHSFAIPIAFILLVYLQIILGELFPKSVALLYPEKLARFFAPPSLVIARIFRPFISILNYSTRFLLRLFGIKEKPQGWYKQLTSEELQLIIATERESTGLEDEERELLNNILELGEVTAVKVMIPRTEIQFIKETATFGELLESIATNKFFRYPVMGKSIDDIKGIIDYKTLAIPLSKGQLTNSSLIKNWIQPVSFIGESKPLYELLSFMQESSEAMVIVVDEFGGTSGLITLHDIISEIIGYEHNDSKTAINSIQNISDRVFLVPAQINIEFLNEQLELNLPLAEEYNTLSGFLQEKWQKIPTQGEILRYEDNYFTVVSAGDNRLYTIKITRSFPLEIPQTNFNGKSQTKNSFLSS